jgi:hypothetical protein
MEHALKLNSPYCVSFREVPSSKERIKAIRKEIQSQKELLTQEIRKLQKGEVGSASMKTRSLNKVQVGGAKYGMVKDEPRSSCSSKGHKVSKKLKRTSSTEDLLQSESEASTIFGLKGETSQLIKQEDSVLTDINMLWGDSLTGNGDQAPLITKKEPIPHIKKEKLAKLSIRFSEIDHLK